MKKTTILFILLFTGLSIHSFGQARSELNFGLLGINYEIPVHRDITIAPGASTNLDLDWLTLYVKGNYYFDNLFDINNDAWDVYGGASAGFAIYNGDEDEDSGLDIGLQVGGRWFWNDKWGVYLELGGGSVQGATGGVGLTVKL
ncbi:MAG TPA: hypothetical protein VN192_00050 [Flavobacterium sp.]|jgi:hypothetical protein|nr:hypothetical protein [Flavobacterium sp.]